MVKPPQLCRASVAAPSEQTARSPNTKQVLVRSPKIYSHDDDRRHAYCVLTTIMVGCSSVVLIVSFRVVGKLGPVIVVLRGMCDINARSVSWE